MKLKAIAIIFIFSIGSCSGLYWSYSQNFSQGFLPKKIEVTGFALLKEDFGFREGCGVKVFELLKHTLDKINQQGLAFLKNATKARGYDPKKHRYNHYYSYKQWQETPVQESENNRNFWIGLRCAEGLGLDKPLSEKIASAASAKGSYYTGHYEGQLVVIPSLGLVVLSYMG